MAISSYPSPADAGVLCVILANTVIYISIVKQLLRSILHVIGINLAPREELSTEPSESAVHRKTPSDSYIEDFRSKTPAKCYDSIFICDCPKQECSICLAEFEPNSEIHRLSCGHIFHCSCLEKWLKYWNTTCPLCRNCMMSQEVEEEEEEDSCPM